MDILDVRILGALNNAPSYQWDARPSMASLAQELDVDPETVRLRVRRMEAHGILDGYEVVVNPTLLGRRMVRVEVPGLAEEAKERAIEQLSHLDGVHWFFDLYRGGLSLVMYLEPGPSMERTCELVAAITGERVEAWDMPLRDATVVPDATDWRLVRALRRNARMPYAELAEVLGTSSRTVQRRLNKLVEGRGLIQMLRTDFDRMAGIVPVEVRVVLSKLEARSEVARALLDRDDVVFANVHGELLIGSYGLRNVREGEVLRRRLAAMDGVAEVRADVIARRLSLGTWLDGAIDAKVQATARA